MFIRKSTLRPLAYKLESDPNVTFQNISLKSTVTLDSRDLGGGEKLPIIRSSDLKIIGI